jgi:signal transduction histidine kinase
LEEGNFARPDHPCDAPAPAASARAQRAGARRLAPLGAALELRRRFSQQRQANQLSQLVNDLLDVARVSQGKVKLLKLPTEVNDLVSKALGLTLVQRLIHDRPSLPQAQAWGRQVSSR